MQHKTLVERIKSITAGDILSYGLAGYIAYSVVLGTANLASQVANTKTINTVQDGYNIRAEYIPPATGILASPFVRGLGCDRTGRVLITASNSNEFFRWYDWNNNGVLDPSEKLETKSNNYDGNPSILMANGINFSHAPTTVALKKEIDDRNFCNSLYQKIRTSIIANSNPL
jgi:hypothetical protein